MSQINNIIVILIISMTIIRKNVYRVESIFCRAHLWHYIYELWLDLYSPCIGSPTCGNKFLVPQPEPLSNQSAGTLALWSYLLWRR